MSEHTGSRVHRQSFNHSVERIFLLLFSLPPLLPFFLPFVSHAAEFPRSPIRTITVTPRAPRFVISSSPLPNYLSTVQTDLFDTNRGHNRRPSAVLLGSARIIRSFHERYRVVVKSTRPVLITTHRSIPQLRSFFLSIPLRSTIFFQPRRVFLFHFSHDDFSDLLASIEP